jgi:ferritin-like protein
MEYIKSELVEQKLTRLIYERENGYDLLADLEIVLKEKLLHKQFYTITVFFMISRSEEIIRLINNQSEVVFNKFYMLILAFLRIYENDVNFCPLVKTLWRKFQSLSYRPNVYSLY